MLHVGLAFDELRRGMELVSNRGPQLLRLHSAPSFAAQWLTPRLSRFLSSHPGVEVRLAASTDYARFVNDEFDADIVYGPTPRGRHGLHPARRRDRDAAMCSPVRGAHHRRSTIWSARF